MNDRHSKQQVEVLNGAPLSNGNFHDTNERPGSTIYVSGGRGTGSSGRPLSGLNSMQLSAMLFLVSSINLECSAGYYKVDKYRLSPHAESFLSSMQEVYEKTLNRKKPDKPVS